MTAGSSVRTTHTSQLSPADLRAIRSLLDEAFDGDFTDQDFEHSLGGMHTLISEGTELVAHGSVVMRRLLHRGRSLRTGYVEGVGVRADRRRMGLGDAVMAELEAVVLGGYEIGALSSSEDGRDFYAARGWQPWTGTASVLSPDGILRTPREAGGIYLLPGDVALDSAGDLACDWRDGDVW